MSKSNKTYNTIEFLVRCLWKTSWKWQDSITLVSPTELVKLELWTCARLGEGKKNVKDKKYVLWWRKQHNKNVGGVILPWFCVLQKKNFGLGFTEGIYEKEFYERNIFEWVLPMEMNLKGFPFYNTFENVLL